MSACSLWIALARLSAASETRYRRAMPVRVSPRTTLWVRELAWCGRRSPAARTAIAEGTIDQVSSNERVIEVYLGR